MRISLVTPYIFSALVVILAANAGLAERLGAHPFWSIAVAWIGVPIGLLMAMATRWFSLKWPLRVAVFGVGLAASFLMAGYGKERFAASFAEDAAAGRMWYMGWIATMAFASAFIAALFSPTPIEAES